MGNDSSLLDELLCRLSSTFKIRDLGSPTFFLSIETIPLDGGILLSQRRYMDDILTRAVNRLCQFMRTPTDEHWAMLKRVLRYVKGTLTHGLRLSASSSSDVHAYSDSDWAGCPMDRKSTSGYAVFLGSNLVSWVSRKQRTVARSSTEAEYKGLADVAAEVTWVMSLLRELGLNSGNPATLWCDNLGATYMCANPVFHARTKHVEIDYHFVRDKVSTGEFLVNFVSTKDQLADIFTKPLASARFSSLRENLNVVSSPSSA
ncbi:PREDICTED: uncharacterized protein LOC109147061 [Ipomoea nil]|uniref:uncharacterized protein LOC109147061 n=1 Tax=Ipomoea nil TaxID=35883 RepID=UPI0009019603|nr:PREDICTED: uncharacterized protein LOC109147061 [Ipomoea nil]